MMDPTKCLDTYLECPEVEAHVGDWILPYWLRDIIGQTEVTRNKHEDTLLIDKTSSTQKNTILGFGGVKVSIDQYSNLERATNKSRKIPSRTVSIGASLTKPKQAIKN
jgi:hypothetical protein